ncbi:acyl-ACP--UDP-N-acetylglucosamine O-acyltransferase [Almyronema epifaneia]|uniref:Acyl-[acyl-carrier-protein]--UDP-N-acetylglucosamine O-acyltransferase n=1 Tax=Almyronema epifaneia S1 TaxID=2991925 RepID=A0ABW6IBA7_9CYAN
MTTLIHPTAVIHPGAQIHPSVKVGPYAVIGEKVSVGPETVIGSHVILAGHTEVGARNQIFPGAAIGLEPQDLKYDGSLSLVKIGDNNSIREYVTINRPTRFGEETRLGNNNLLMAYAHVAHNCWIEDQVIIANSVALAGHIHIESNARLSGLVGVHQFVHIGQHSMIGGMSRIDRDVPPFTIVEGNPSRVRALNQIGLQRAGLAQIDQGQRYRELKQAFRLIYRSRLPLNEALDQLDDLSHNDYVRHLQQFLRDSQQPERRGPIPGNK